MTHIITSLCLRSERCVAYCPVDCIVPGQPIDQWPHTYIDPQVCIDCGLCVPACPYSAIWPEDGVPDVLQADIQPNTDFFRQSQSAADLSNRKQKKDARRRPPRS